MERDESSLSTTSATDALDDERRKVALEKQRLEEEESLLTEKKTLEEKRQKIAEEKAALEARKNMTLAMGKRPSVSTANEIKRDGRFIAYDNETVVDTWTNLMWAAKDNGSDINWANAELYCEHYRGGKYTDWRLPTQYELAGLYDAAKTYKVDCGGRGYDVHLTDLIRLTCTLPWASETDDSLAAYFYFIHGQRNLRYKSDENLGRALPVRFAK